MGMPQIAAGREAQGSSPAGKLYRQVMRMSDFEIISIFLMIIGLLISVYKLGRK